MNNLVEFCKITIQGGFLVLLPLLLLILLLMEIFDLVQGIAAPVAALFPTGTFEDPGHPVLISILLLVGASFIIGLAMRSDSVMALGRRLEEKTIGRFAVYQFVKTLVPSLLGAKKANSFRSGLFDAGNGQEALVYIVEELDDGRMAVLFPMAPTGFSGPVRIVPADRVSPLDANVGDVSLVLNHMGLGTGRLLNKND